MIDCKVLFVVLITSLFFGCSTGSKNKVDNNSPAKIIQFDKDWQFHKGDVKGAQNPDFNDSKWRTLNVPHDWMIEGPYNKNNLTGSGGGYLPAGIGWYRKSFTLDKKLSQKEISIEFGGIMANSDVWINGYHLGHRPNGYVSFCYDLTGHLYFGENKPNILAVRVDDSLQPASRYYTGAGIYRKVRLIAANPVHIAHWDIYITTPQVSHQEALIEAQTNVVNESAESTEVTVRTTIMAPSGKAVGSASTKATIDSGKSKRVLQKVEITNPSLWGIHHPALYSASTKIYAGGKLIDNEIHTFGIRKAVFKAATGFWLNGKNIKIKGVCLHHDAGSLGAAVPLDAWKRRLNLLKEAGVNAIRTAHNPPSTDFLNLCDRMGFLIMDEAFDTWDAAKNHAKYGYNLHFDKWWKRDLTSMIMRDRNHPSIIIWSVGNEIRDNLNDSSGFRKYRNLQGLVHKLDPSRPVTMALFRPGSSHVYTNGFAKMMDVVGQNYRMNELIAAHEAHPNWKVTGTEDGQSRSNWVAVRDHPFIAGEFLWVGFDYLGEAEWPAISYSNGLFNRIGRWQPNGYKIQSWWSQKPVVHIVRKQSDGGTSKWTANWTPIHPEKYKVADVRVYSNCDEVELFLNGKPLGTKPRSEDLVPPTWNIPFEKGTIRAIGKDKGEKVAVDELKTAGKPAKIILETKRDSISKDWDSVSYITAKIVDRNNVLCPYSNNLITFSVSGPGKIIAVDNGNPTGHESYQVSKRQAFHGMCIAVIRAKKNHGEITVTAASPGLKGDAVHLTINQ